MTEMVAKVGRQARDWAGFSWPINGTRLVLIFVLTAVAAISPEMRKLVFGSLSDAYLQVTVFVAATLALVYFFEQAFGFDLGLLMGRSKYLQSPIASFLGALPGCGGAIIVITNYTRGHVSFGGVVAVLIATMGDAAFLLIAREPKTGLMIMAIGLIMGTISGWIVDAIHGPDFMRPDEPDKQPQPACAAIYRTTTASHSGESHPGEKSWEGFLNFASTRIWIVLAAPAAFIGLGVAMQLDTDILFGPFSGADPTMWLGVIGGALCLLMWAWSSQENAHSDLAHEKPSRKTIMERVIKDTNFVTSWVVVGFPGL